MPTPPRPTPTPTGDADAATPSATFGNNERHALTVTVDVRTNSLLLGGTKHYVELAGSIIAELDSSVAQERQTKVYRLRYAQAEEIETALQSFLDDERARLTQTLGEEGLPAAQRMLEREVAVVAEPSSNTLLLSASSRYFPQFAEIVNELDQPKPQVLIHVLLAEVTLTDDLDLGFEWNYVEGIGSATLDVGTDFGVSQALSQFGGFGLAVTGGDFSFVLRALKANNRLKILSRPQILAADNQPAAINVGQRVPIITSSQVTDEGRIINSVTYQQVGIGLEVIPRINPDGMVAMEVSPNISSLADSTVEIQEGVNAPIINETVATTTVTVQDGHTIILGGLIRTQDAQNERKVPLLGDVPVVGGLFKRTETSSERSELLIILTPHVIRSPDEADRALRDHIDRSELMKDMEVDEVQKPLYEQLNSAFPPSPLGPPPARPEAVESYLLTPRQRLDGALKLREVQGDVHLQPTQGTLEPGTTTGELEVDKLEGEVNLTP